MTTKLSASPQPPRAIAVQDAYDEGCRLATVYGGDLHAAVIEEDLDYYIEEDLRSACWHAGFEGRPCPVWAEGWRHGAIPESGKSRNYRDDHAEPGVSMMWVRDVHGVEHGTGDAVSAMFIARRGRRTEYSGWLVGWGSDGEPCLLR